MIGAAQEGFRAVRRSWGLAVLLLGVNLFLAALLAIPMAQTLEKDLAHTDAASNMLYGFDYPWWSRWSEEQSGWTSTFGPDMFGPGFAFKNVEWLLRGQLPAGIFAGPRRTEGQGAAEPGLDPIILGWGVVYILVQTFLAGGVLGVLRGEQGLWTMRGLFHGSGFYFGRFLRLAILALLADAVIFVANAPFARWADTHAREAVSETTALVWLLGRHALLLLAILFVHMVSNYAKVIVVIEERSSAILAFLSSLAFCCGNLFRTAGHYLGIAGIGVLLLIVWNLLDSRWDTTGYKTQMVTLLLGQALVAGRIALRLALLGGQVALYRKLASNKS